MRRTLQDALRLLSLHRWIFFVPFCFVSCAAFVGSLYYPRTYSATTTFEVRNDPVMSNLPLSAGVTSFRYFRNTMVRDLTSSECMSEVVEKLGLVKDAQRNPDGTLTREWARRRESLARSLGSDLNINTSSPSELIDIVKISYTGTDPAIGKGLVDAVKHTYIRRTRTWIKDFLINLRDYFLREAEEGTLEVTAAQREETQLRLENPHVNPTDPGAISTRIAQLEMERRELQMRKREYESELGAQRQLLATLEAPIAASGGVEQAGDSAPVFVSAETLGILSQIQELHHKVANLREARGMTDEHPAIRELLADRRRLEEQLKERRSIDERMAQLQGPPAGDFARPAGEVSAATSNGQGERARMMVQVAAITGKLKDLEVNLRMNEMTLDDLNKAKSELFQKQEEFTEVIGRVSKARQRQSQINSTLSTIEPAIKAAEQDRLLQFSEGQPARGSATPVSPKAVTVVLLALLAGAVVGVAFVVMAEVLDHVYRSSGQVARGLGLPMLEAIDEIVTGNDRRRMVVHQAVVTPLVIAMCVGLTGLTCSMAYLSLTQPWTYQRIRNIPQAALDLFIDTHKAVSDNTSQNEP
jgi:capsular polysaccharide biosynthesis protein